MIKRKDNEKWREYNKNRKKPFYYGFHVDKSLKAKMFELLNEIKEQNEKFTISNLLENSLKRTISEWENMKEKVNNEE